MASQKEVRVAAVMTAPRYECVGARTTIERAMNQCGIPLTISGGVFYHQCMQQMFEDLVDKELDYILTIDFDSMFIGQHVNRLLSMIVQEDYIDALAAMQPMRGKGRLLGSKRQENEMIWDGKPLRVDSAHFGLTAIKAEKLQTLQKPWFCSQPDENGSWGDGRVDADVWFWRQWEQAGNNIYIDPGCRLGHMEEMVTVYDEQMQLKHYYPEDWKEVSKTTVDS